MKRPRWLQRMYARLNGYFWLPCPYCGQEFGGHEVTDGMVCSPEPGLWKIPCPECAKDPDLVWLG
jgi:hypothetical protein